MDDIEFQISRNVVETLERIATALEHIAKIQRRTFQAQQNGICNQHESGACGACDYCEPL